MPNFTRSAAVLAGCAALLPLTGCAHFRKHGGDTAYVARDVNTLYAAAQRMMDNRDYDTAAKLFDEVERQHP
jgi:outer membrane protein assembly factor BamD